MNHDKINRRLFPECIRIIGICAPAGRLGKKDFEAGCRVLRRQGFALEIAENAMNAGDAPAYLSASAEARLSDLNELIRGNCDLILCARGGFGSVHLLEGIDWDTLRRKNLPVAGYSDITALHLAMLRQHAGIPVSSPMLSALPDLPPFTERRFRRAMKQLGKQEHGTGKLERLAAFGEYPVIQAPVFCANLTMLASLCGTPFLPSFRGMILVLEDIDEPVRKLDRCLEQLRLCGIFQGVSAVIFGDFSGCGRPSEQIQLFGRFQEEISLPVFSGLRFGHCKNTNSFLCGEKLTIEKGVLYAGN